MPDARSIAVDIPSGMDTHYAFDGYGRMTSKSDGTYSATYAYRYDDKLASVTSDFPSEGNATYQYDGAGKRRQRTGGGTTTRYRWDLGWTVLNEEDNLGNLTRTYIGRGAAHVDGTNPASGTWRFYVHDHLGSTRGVYNSDKTPYAGLEHTPYGELYASSGSVSDITRRYTGHDWDEAAELYYAPYRYYAPGLAMWITRDPLGMIDGPNMYSYVAQMPIEYNDYLGRSMSLPALILLTIGLIIIAYTAYSFCKNGKECMDALHDFKKEIDLMVAQGELKTSEDVCEDEMTREQRRRRNATRIQTLSTYDKVMDECPGWIRDWVGGPM